MQKVLLIVFVFFLLVPAVWFFAFREKATLDVAAGYGTSPNLPSPNPSQIPRVNIAPAIGWPVDVIPAAAKGFRVNGYAAEIDHPRLLYVLPNGDVLVAESNAPTKSGTAFSRKASVIGPMIVGPVDSARHLL